MFCKDVTFAVVAVVRGSRHRISNYIIFTKDLLLSGASPTS